MRIGMCASLSLRIPCQLDLLEDVDALTWKEGHNRLLPGSFLSVDPASAAPNRARSARTLHVHGVDSLDPDIEEFLYGFADLDLVRYRRHLKRVLILLHEVSVLLGDQWPDNDLIDCQRWHLGLPRRGDGGTARPARHTLLFPGTRFASIFGKSPQAFHSRDCFSHDHHAIKFQNVPHIQISRIDNPDTGEIA